MHDSYYLLWTEDADIMPPQCEDERCSWMQVQETGSEGGALRPFFPSRYTHRTHSPLYRSLFALLDISLTFVSDLLPKERSFLPDTFRPDKHFAASARFITSHLAGQVPAAAILPVHNIDRRI